jgi:hypothetical protein
MRLKHSYFTITRCNLTAETLARTADVSQNTAISLIQMYNTETLARTTADGVSNTAILQ